MKEYTLCLDDRVASTYEHYANICNNSVEETLEAFLKMFIENRYPNTCLFTEYVATYNNH